ncbi:calcium-binding protein [Roseovarius sp. M141]|nr:calcium-binding protein [Roseovarius sp. M141]
MMQGGGSGMMGDMSGMMQKMHGMHGNKMGGMGNMGSGMMGGAMMQMLDADGDGNVTPEEMREQMQAKLTEYDSDGDGTLSISEFEALHSAMIREKMVDKFQHLDADGDGAITSDEMTAPAKKMERMQKMRSGMMEQMQGQPGAGQGMGSDMNDADDAGDN